MADVWKHKQSVNWYAKFKGADGKWKNRSTGATDKAEAQRIADGWRIEADRERSKQNPEVSLGGFSDITIRAQQLAMQDRMTAQAAQAIVNDIMRACGKKPLNILTHQGWCDSWKATRRGEVKERSLMKYNQVCADWLEYLGEQAAVPIDALAKTTAVAYRDHLISSGLAPRSVNQTIKLLRGIYQEAIEQDHLTRNPFVGIGSQKTDPTEAKREPFTVEEVDLLIRTAEGDWKGMNILAATSGLRLMDCARLKWSNLDLNQTKIHVKTAKTGSIIETLIHPDLLNWLKKQPRGIGDAPVFPSLANKAGAGKSGLSMAFKRLMTRAGVSAGVVREKKADSRGRTTSKKSFHSFRYFLISELAKAKVRPEVARSITGHADAEMHANYVRPDFATKSEAISQISISA